MPPQEAPWTETEHRLFLSIAPSTPRLYQHASDESRCELTWDLVAHKMNRRAKESEQECRQMTGLMAESLFYEIRIIRLRFGITTVKDARSSIEDHPFWDVPLPLRRSTVLKYYESLNLPHNIEMMYPAAFLESGKYKLRESGFEDPTYKNSWLEGKTVEAIDELRPEHQKMYKLRRAVDFDSHINRLKALGRSVDNLNPEEDENEPSLIEVEDGPAAIEGAMLPPKYRRSYLRKPPPLQDTMLETPSQSHESTEDRITNMESAERYTDVATADSNSESQLENVEREATVNKGKGKRKRSSTESSEDIYGVSDTEDDQIQSQSTGTQNNPIDIDSKSPEPRGPQIELDNSQVYKDLNDYSGSTSLSNTEDVPKQPSADDGEPGSSSSQVVIKTEDVEMRLEGEDPFEKGVERGAYVLESIEADQDDMEGVVPS